MGEPIRKTRSLGWALVEEGPNEASPEHPNGSNTAHNGTHEVLVHLHGEHLRKKAFIRVVQIRERADFEHRSVQWYMRGGEINPVPVHQVGQSLHQGHYSALLMYFCTFRCSK